MQKSDHLSNDFLHVNELPFRSTLLEEQPRSLDDFRCTCSVSNDSHSSRACLFEIWCVGGKPAHTGLGIGDGGGNRLIHFVRQRSSQLSHGGHPVHVREVCLRLTQSLSLFLRPLALGDVDHGTHKFNEIAGWAQNRMADVVDVFDSAAPKEDSDFHFVIRLFTYCSIDCPLPPGLILRMNALQPFFPSRHALFWIEAIYAIPFLGQMQGVSSRHPPGPTPGMREPLCFRQ